MKKNKADNKLTVSTYSVFKGKIRMAGNLCVNGEGRVNGHLSELGKNLCGLKLDTVKRKLSKAGYKLILNP